MTDREEPPTRRQRVARAVVQLRALVAMASKTDSDQCRGCNVVFDGGGFCGELHHRVTRTVRARRREAGQYGAELARTVGGPGVGEAREAYDVVGWLQFGSLR